MTEETDTDQGSRRRDAEPGGRSAGPARGNDAPSRHRMFVLYQSVPRVLLFRFATGMAVGLGTVIGATVLLSFIVWSLSQVEFIPDHRRLGRRDRPAMSEDRFGQ
jgi:hypothetical protein